MSHFTVIVSQRPREAKDSPPKAIQQVRAERQALEESFQIRDFSLFTEDGRLRSIAFRLSRNNLSSPRAHLLLSTGFGGVAAAGHSFSSAFSTTLQGWGSRRPGGVWVQPRGWPHPRVCVCLPAYLPTRLLVPTRSLPDPGQRSQIHRPELYKGSGPGSLV